jgi:hypothetical protein
LTAGSAWLAGRDHGRDGCAISAALARLGPATNIASEMATPLGKNGSSACATRESRCLRQDRSERALDSCGHQESTQGAVSRIGATGCE